MELIRGIHNINASHHACALTIGKFDGVHKGHQAVLLKLVQKAKSLGVPSVVMVFEPQPDEVFSPASAPARISRLRDKYHAFSALGIDRLLCVSFSKRFANMSPQDFVQDLLISKLGVKFLVVGDDFKFGFKRQGDFSFLQKAAAQSDFDVVNTDSFRINDSRISSTAIRDALQAGDFALAAKMLGKPYAISGKVVHGEKKGRTIGFPTANILLKRHKAAVNGVFAVRVLIAGSSYNGVANLGRRPTLNGEQLQLETHIFEYDKNLYGQYISVEFVEKIRDEIKFESFAELKQQIKSDAQQAKISLSRFVTMETHNE